MVFARVYRTRNFGSFCSEDGLDRDFGGFAANHHDYRSQCSTSSFESIDPETLAAEQFSSEELDLLSMCLSEVSSDSSESQMNSVIYDIMQAQLALWTLVFSVLYSYAWQQHRKKFLLSLFFVVPTVFTVSCGIAALLTAVVILGRIFCSPVYFNDLFKLGKSMDPCVEQTMYPRLRRSSSGASSRSTLSIHSVRSTDELPIPLCRRHSNGSLNGAPDSRQLSRYARHLSQGK